ncbi:MAG: 5-methyltetrahydropteroyltriglutamate--homocysteine S-methyltransferase, partial [Bacteroidales bacterium]
MITHNLGFPRIGARRELKFALEKFWKNELSATELINIGKSIRQHNWQLQQEAGIELIPVNDFSYYDQVLDISLMLGNIPLRYASLLSSFPDDPFKLYFAMARGLQDEMYDIPAMEMTKWFNTNYHYIVPEFYVHTSFQLFSKKVLEEFREAQAMGINAKPVLLGPVSYILLGKAKDLTLTPFTILEGILPVYQQILQQLESMGCKWVQIDEPMLATDLQSQHAELFQMAYHFLTVQLNSMSILLGTYFGEITHNLGIINQLPIDALHVDLVSAPLQLDELLYSLNATIGLSLGIVDGRNIWKNNFERSLKIIKRTIEVRGAERVMIAPSCSLLHVPYDLALETNEKALPSDVKYWMAFARQKLDELKTLKALMSVEKDEHAWALEAYAENVRCMANRMHSDKVRNEKVAARTRKITTEATGRKSTFSQRYALQQEVLRLPLLPTTTIGSFPQTTEVRKVRNQYRKGLITEA